MPPCPCQAAEIVTANSTSWIQTTAEVRDSLMECLTTILGTEGVIQNFPGDINQVLPNTLSVRFQGIHNVQDSKNLVYGKTKKMPKPRHCILESTLSGCRPTISFHLTEIFL